MEAKCLAQPRYTEKAVGKPQEASTEVRDSSKKFEVYPAYLQESLEG